MSRLRRFHYRQDCSVVITVVLTGNMPNGCVMLVTCVTGSVTLVTRANYWHVVLWQQQQSKEERGMCLNKKIINKY